MTILLEGFIIVGSILTVLSWCRIYLHWGYERREALRLASPEPTHAHVWVAVDSVVTGETLRWICSVTDCWAQQDLDEMRFPDDPYKRQVRLADSRKVKGKPAWQKEKRRLEAAWHLRDDSLRLREDAVRLREGARRMREANHLGEAIRHRMEFEQALEEKRQALRRILEDQQRTLGQIVKTDSGCDCDHS